VNNLGAGRAANLSLPIPATPYAAVAVVASTIGHFVWSDQNSNGIQDAGEPGISGFIVHLTNAAGTILATTTTSPTGAYSFGNLHSGTYRVVFDPASLTAGQQFTQQGAGSNPAVDSDASTTTGATGSFALGVNSSNPTLDAGIVPAARLELRKTLAPASDPGRFDLLIDGTPTGSGRAVGDGGTTGIRDVLPGSHTVGEAGVNGAFLVNYSTTTNCVNRADGSAVTVTGAAVTLAPGADVVCTITNTRNALPPVPVILAYTGVAIVMPILVGNILLAAGVMFVLIRRRRRKLIAQ